MLTSALPRPVGVRTGATATLAALLLAGTALIGAPAAVAAPGDNGDIKIHPVGTRFGDPKDTPRVCKFYLDATGFDVAQGITYTIQPQPPLPNTATLNGAITLASGIGHTDPLALPDGQYKVTYKVLGGAAAGKEKVFNVDCPSTVASPAPGPQGGVHAGGGGLAQTTEAFSPVAGAAAVGLVVVGGVVYFRLLRRRTDGAA
ncbi:hypothetical protein [Streptomyces sp. NPDC058371]|uniref:hypothetical protein n=1 Tax=Streptomyces sp. NPDC058371 TaxID=3346463 RepID=UPI00364DE49A